MVTESNNTSTSNKQNIESINKDKNDIKKFNEIEEEPNINAENTTTFSSASQSNSTRPPNSYLNKFQFDESGVLLKKWPQIVEDFQVLKWSDDKVVVSSPTELLKNETFLKIDKNAREILQVFTGEGLIKFRGRLFQPKNLSVLADFILGS